MSVLTDLLAIGGKRIVPVPASAIDTIRFAPADVSLMPIERDDEDFGVLEIDCGD